MASRHALFSGLLPSQGSFQAAVTTVGTTLTTVGTTLTTVGTTLTTVGTALTTVGTALTMVGATLTSVETTLTSVGTTLTSVRAALTIVETAPTMVETTLTSVGTTLTSVETTLTIVETTLITVEAALTMVETTLTIVGTTLTTVGTALTLVEATLTMVETTLTIVETALTRVGTAVTLVETPLTRVEAGDNRPTGLDSLSPAIGDRVRLTGRATRRSLIVPRLENWSDPRVSIMSEPRRITERYRLDKRISSKDAGSVFRAVDTLSGETVAVKLINVGSSEEHRAALEAHLAALRDVQHPALPRILDFGLTTAGSAFLITEYLPGEDLGKLAGADPARVLSLLLQLAEGLEALAAQGLAVRNLSAENVWIVAGPRGEQVKILGLGGAAFPGAFPGEPGGADSFRTSLSAFGQLAVRALGLPCQEPGDETIALPLEVAGSLTEPERLRELLDAALHGDPQGQLPTWKEVRQALRTALSGEMERRPAAKAPPAGTVPIPKMGAWEEVRLGQGVPPVPWEGDATLAVERIGPAPAAPAPGPDLTTRVIRPEELAPPPAADAGRQGPVRIPLKELEEAPPGQVLRFPAPAPSSGPGSGMEKTEPRGATLPVPAPPQAPQPAPPPPLPPPVAVVAPRPAPPPSPPVTAAPRPPARKGLRLALLVGLPPTLLLLALVGLVAWWSRRSARPEPPQPQVQAAQARPAAKPAPALPAPKPVHAQIVLAEDSLSASDPAAAKAALAAIPPEQIALFTAEEHDRYQRILDALTLTPLQGTSWTENLAKGLSTGDLRLLRAAVAAPAEAATLTPEQTRDLARARKILDLDGKLAKAQRAKNRPETLRQAGLLLAELPRHAGALQARNQAADALLAEADEHADEGQLDAALAALELLQKGWRDHPGLAERLEQIRAEQRAGDQMEEALAAAAQAERAERPLEGLQALERAQPNGRYIARFQQARDRLQSQFARLDRNPPQIAMTGPSELSYKEEAFTIPLHITDDQGVESTEAWARAEGGRFTKVTLRHLGGSDYALEVPPDLHQRKSIDFYVTATDQSGHSGALGSVQHPQKIKRKGWLSKVLGGKEGG